MGRENSQLSLVKVFKAQSIKQTNFWRLGTLGKKQSERARLLFGQVREDAQIELSLFNRLVNPSHALVIASGGCTALSLATLNKCQLSVIDINPAQIYLTELKSSCFSYLDFDSARNCCTTDASQFYPEMRDRLSSPARSFWDDNSDLLRTGLNRAGWIDQRMRLLNQLFFLLVHDERFTEKFLGQRDALKQEESYFRQWCNWQWRLAKEIAFSKLLLSFGFGRSALNELPPDFQQIMSGKLERALTAFPALDNGYVWQTFLGRYPSDNEEALPPYLQFGRSTNLREGIKRMHLYCVDAIDWLRNQADESVDFFAFSNILELVTREYAEEMARQTARTAKSGAYIVLRSILPNKVHNVLEEQGATLKFEAELSNELESKDRSCFCNFIKIYRKE
jgi:S-adenosylmethionine-diacylglycerol 3-amino-3-carboxypropyl transferase